MSDSSNSDSPPLRPVWIAGVLGHRQLDDLAKLGACIAEQLRVLAAAAAARGGELHLYVSAAAGTDLLAIRAARKLGLPVHLLLPLDEEEFLGDFAGLPDWSAEVRAVLAEARTHPRRDSVEVAPTTGVRPGCYFDADARIVGGADVIVAVWNGAPAAGLGGTGQTVPLARALGKPILRIDPATAGVERSGFPSGEWPLADEKWEWLQAAAGGRPPAGGPEAAEAPLADLKARLSAIARQDSSDFRRRALLALQVTTVAGLLGLVNCLLTGRVPWTIPLAVTVAQSVLLVWTKVVKARLKRRRVNDDWIQARLGAEVWRGVVATHPVSGGMHPVAGRLLPEWRRFAVTVGLASHRLDPPLDLSRPADLEQFKSGYAGRLQTQLGHFEQQRDRSRRRTRWLPVVARACFLLAPLSVGLALLLRTAGRFALLSLSPDRMNSLGMLVFTAVLPAALPLGAATATALVENFDHDRRARRYDEMVAWLRRSLAELPHLQTAASVRSFVESCEDSLLRENLEWAAAQQHVEI